jgi:non-homologous end joining protein Ku
VSLLGFRVNKILFKDEVRKHKIASDSLPARKIDECMNKFYHVILEMERDLFQRRSFLISILRKC